MDAHNTRRGKRGSDVFVPQPAPPWYSILSIDCERPRLSDKVQDEDTVCVYRYASHTCCMEGFVHGCLLIGVCVCVCVCVCVFAWVSLYKALKNPLR